MDMDGWRDILHFDFHGEHVLFSSLRLSSAFAFLVSSLLTVSLCLLEKYLTYVLASDAKRAVLPPGAGPARLRKAAFRASIYWVLTLIRLLYMLLAMTFHVGLILVVVTTLSAGQFAIEYLDASHPQRAPNLHSRMEDDVPLLTRADLRGADEYLDNPPAGARDRPLPGVGAKHPPRRQHPAQKPVHPPDGGDGNSTSIFVIDEADETV